MTADTLLEYMWWLTIKRTLKVFQFFINFVTKENCFYTKYKAAMA